MKKGTMGIRIIVAVCFLSVASVQAATNSWTYTGVNPNNYRWSVDGSWSLGVAPSINDNFNFITNSTTKTVIINANDTVFAPSTLTISNLTVGAPSNTTNTLALTNMNAGAAIPLRILDTLIITNGARLYINNSMLHASNAVISSGVALNFALGTNSSPVVVSNNLTVAGTLNVTDAGGFTSNTYTLFIYSGTLTDNGLTLGTTHSNAACVIDTSTSGQINLIVNGFPSPFTPFQQWQLQYFGCNNSIACPQVAGDADPDGDGMSNTNEFLAGFNPTNNAAYLHVISIVRTNNDMQITYLGANGDPPLTSRTNVLEFTTGAPNGSYSNNFVSVGQTNVLSGGTGLGVVTNMVDTGGAVGASRYYRVRVLVP